MPVMMQQQTLCILNAIICIFDPPLMSSSPDWFINGVTALCDTFITCGFLSGSAAFLSTHIVLMFVSCRHGNNLLLPWQPLQYPACFPPLSSISEPMRYMDPLKNPTSACQA